MTQTEELIHEHMPPANPYGYFDKDHGEYVITRPDTPVPWINYLMGGDLTALVSQTAGGLAFYSSDIAIVNTIAGAAASGAGTGGVFGTYVVASGTPWAPSPTSSTSASRPSTGRTAKGCPIPRPCASASAWSSRRSTGLPWSSAPPIRSTAWRRSTRSMLRRSSTSTCCPARTSRPATLS